MFVREVIDTTISYKLAMIFAVLGAFALKIEFSCNVYVLKMHP